MRQNEVALRGQVRRRLRKEDGEGAHVCTGRTVRGVALEKKYQFEAFPALPAKHLVSGLSLHPLKLVRWATPLLDTHD